MKKTYKLLLFFLFLFIVTKSFAESDPFDSIKVVVEYTPPTDGVIDVEYLNSDHFGDGTIRLRNSENPTAKKNFIHKILASPSVGLISEPTYEVKIEFPETLEKILKPHVNNHSPDVYVDVDLVSRYDNLNELFHGHYNPLTLGGSSEKAKHNLDLILNDTRVIQFFEEKLTTEEKSHLKEIGIGRNLDYFIFNDDYQDYLSKNPHAIEVNDKIRYNERLMRFSNEMDSKYRESYFEEIDNIRQKNFNKKSSQKDIQFIMSTDNYSLYDMHLEKYDGFKKGLLLYAYSLEKSQPPSVTKYTCSSIYPDLEKLDDWEKEWIDRQCKMKFTLTRSEYKTIGTIHEKLTVTKSTYLNDITFDVPLLDGGDLYKNLEIREVAFNNISEGVVFSGSGKVPLSGSYTVSNGIQESQNFHYLLNIVMIDKPFIELSNETSPNFSRELLATYVHLHPSILDKAPIIAKTIYSEIETPINPKFFEESIIAYVKQNNYHRADPYAADQERERERIESLVQERIDQATSSLKEQWIKFFPADSPYSNDVIRFHSQVMANFSDYDKKDFVSLHMNKVQSLYAQGNRTSSKIKEADAYLIKIGSYIKELSLEGTEIEKTWREYLLNRVEFYCSANGGYRYLGFEVYWDFINESPMFTIEQQNSYKSKCLQGAQEHITSALNKNPCNFNSVIDLMEKEETKKVMPEEQINSILRKNESYVKKCEIKTKKELEARKKTRTNVKPLCSSAVQKVLVKSCILNYGRGLQGELCIGMACEKCGFSSNYNSCDLYLYK